MLRTLAARDPTRYPLLLDSAAAGPLSAASVLLALPRAALTLSAEGMLGGSGMRPRARASSRRSSTGGARARPRAADPGALPFYGGWALFLSYELAQEVEPHLSLPVTPLPWLAFALRTPCALVHELKSGRVLATAEPGGEAALEVLERMPAAPPRRSRAPIPSRSSRCRRRIRRLTSSACDHLALRATREAERLRRSEDHLARAQKIAHTGSIEQDLRTGAIAWSGETYRIFGLDPNLPAPVGKAFLDLIHPDDRAACATQGPAHQTAQRCASFPTCRAFP